MLRVDHSGEICAQALYQAQGCTARDADLKQHMRQAQIEEQDHLNWCNQRLNELGGKPSLLNPFWGVGSYAIGFTAGIAGDSWSLGFLGETEKQVTTHLEKQLMYLSERDKRTRAVLEQMRLDEIRHGTDAFNDHRAKDLPGFVKTLMRYSAKVMTTTAQYI